MNHLPVLVVVIPLGGAFLISLVDVLRPGLKAAAALLVATAHGAALIMTAHQVIAGPLGPGFTLLYSVSGWTAPVGINLSADRFAAFFLLLLATGHLATVLYRIGSENSSGWEGKTAALIALYFAALSGITITADLFNLFVFVELATVCSIGLIARKRRPESAVAGFVYLMTAAVSGGLLLFAVLVIYVATGTVSMPLVAQAASQLPAHLHTGVTAAVIVSFGIKFGLIPLHFWQPRAYHAAGTTAAAILSAFGMKIYIYALLRLLWVPLQAPALLPEVFDLLLIMGMINILIGHLMAMIEPNLVRMLAFSSIAHVGYILLGVAAAGQAGTRTGEHAAVAALAAALFHAAMHALMKSALLWSGHRFVLRSLSSKIMDHGGVARRAPGSMAAFSLASLAIIGIPPTGGFASKWFVALAQNHLLPVLVIGAGTGISLIYYARYFLVATAHTGGKRVSQRRAFAPRVHLETIIVLTLASAAVLAGILNVHLQTFFAGAAEDLLDQSAFIETALLRRSR